MYKVTINQKSLDYLKAYFTLYREYYEDLYKDISLEELEM